MLYTIPYRATEKIFYNLEDELKKYGFSASMSITSHFTHFRVIDRTSEINHNVIIEIQKALLK